MGNITASELRTKGIAQIRKLLADWPEVFISVRGAKRYVVIDLERFTYLRECELDAALLEAKEDPQEKRLAVERVEEHLRR